MCACVRECVNVRRCTQGCVCVCKWVLVCVRARNARAVWWMERRCAAHFHASKDQKGSKESLALQALPMALHTTPCAPLPHLRRDLPVRDGDGRRKRSTSKEWMTVLKERRILDVRSHAHCCCAAAAFPPSPPDFRGVVQLADWAPQLALTSAGPGASAGGGGLRIAGLIANKLSLKARHQLVPSRRVHWQGTLPAAATVMAARRRGP